MKRRLVLGASAIVLASCSDVSSYSTAPGESYCGSIVQGAFVRAAYTSPSGTTYFGPDAQVRVTWSADRATGSPGVVTTSDGLLREAPLRAPPQEFADPLSTLQFGEGRKKNYLYFAEPSDGSGAMVAVISLLDGGDAELRLLRAGTAPTNAQLFGVFPLTKQKGECFATH